jgi:hypothetical protein
MAAVRIETVVGPDGTIQIRAPELTPGQHVTVTVEAAETPPTEKQHAIDILAEMPGHRLFKTAEEVDAYIREERESWDR